MARWQAMFDRLVDSLGSPVIDPDHLRIGIDDELWRFEQEARSAEAIDVLETPEQRVSEFQDELRKKLGELSNTDLENKVWREALMLLDNPRLRVPDDKRPR